MNLSHREKVTIRRGLKELRRIDQDVELDDPMTDALGAGEFVAQAAYDRRRRVVVQLRRASRVCRRWLRCCELDQARDQLEGLAEHARLLSGRERFRLAMVRESEAHLNNYRRG